MSKLVKWLNAIVELAPCRNLSIILSWLTVMAEVNLEDADLSNCGERKLLKNVNLHCSTIFAVV